MNELSLLYYASIIDMISLGQGLVFGCILIFLSSKRRPSLLLGLFLITLGGSYIFNIMADRGITESYPYLFFLPIHFYLLSYPLLFLYVHQLIYRSNIRSHIKHLIPGILEFILFTCLLVLVLFGKLNLSAIRNGILEGAFILTVNIFVAFYLFKTLSLLKKNKNLVYDFHSEVENKLLGWVKTLVNAFLILICINITFLSFQFLFIVLKVSIPATYVLTAYVLVGISELVLMYWAVIFGVRQHYIVLDNLLDKKTTKGPIVFPKSTNQDDFDHIYNQLIILIEQSKCFKNKELTIVDLAKLIDIHYRKLSQIINYKTSSNFNSFINKYRVKEAKEILLDPKRSKMFTMEGLGHEVGFKSRSSMYIAFKKFENCTPGKFIKHN